MCIREQTPEFAVSVFDIEGEWLGHEIDAPCPYEGPQILVCTLSLIHISEPTRPY